ncbi:hypothetical protein AX16_009214 [Volvariella volvacea WC 439]|nr:hypothetical protein AX16_009214 [Volvariella volvacea WC 439]
MAYNFQCTYVEAAKKRGPPKGYVENLENRVEKLERLIRRLSPGDDLLTDLDKNIDREAWVMEKVASQRRSVLEQAARIVHPQSTPGELATDAIRKSGCEYSFDNPPDDDFIHVMLADNLEKLSINQGDYRFFGKSSSAMLIQTAIELKNEYTGNEVEKPQLSHALAKRPEFWSVRPWEQAAAQSPQTIYDFPPEELIHQLVDLYFKHTNIFLPLLHRPTFERLIQEQLHQRHEMFGAVLLLVCAVASRYSDDPRVRLDGEKGFHSNGWKYFHQVQLVKKSLLSPPSLYELQFYCLSVQFLQGTSAPQACWTMVGIGIRLAQDVGAHRKKANREVSAEGELWKRAFWVLVTMDRMFSSALGRPCAIQDEDFDLDLPLEVDDEYWDHPDPEQRFKQPPNKPSVISAFVLYLRLNQILAFSLRTIYSINKSKILLGFIGPQWEQHIVAELDSALNKWVDTVPDYLRWDPTRENEVFFHQSVLLYTSYYNIQILIHRPFIPSPRKPSPLSFPSLAICTNAARSCSHIVDIHRSRFGLPLSQVLMSVFTAGIVLLLNIWGGKRSGLSTDPKREMADVHKCMQVLRACEGRWHSAGRLWDILYELASVGELPLPQPSPPSGNKRERGSDSPRSGASSCDSPSDSLDVPRSIAGTRRVSNRDPLVGISDAGGIGRVASTSSTASSTTASTAASALGTSGASGAGAAGTLQPQSWPPPQAAAQQHPSPQSMQQSAAAPVEHLFTLPVYSEELGSLPLHGQVQFSPRGQSPLSAPNYWYQPFAGAGAGGSSAGGAGAGAGGFGGGGPGGMGDSYMMYARQVPSSPSSSSPTYSDPYSLGDVIRSGATAGAAASSNGAPGPPGGPSPAGLSGSEFSLMSVAADGRGHPAGPGAGVGVGVGHGAGRQAYLPGSSRGMSNNVYGYGGFMDSATMEMWSNAPTGIELDDWGTYLSNVSELAQSLQQQQPHQGDSPSSSKP